MLNSFEDNEIIIGSILYVYFIFFVNGVTYSVLEESVTSLSQSTPDY